MSPFHAFVNAHQVLVSCVIGLVGGVIGAAFVIWCFERSRSR